ncbi:MAG: SpoIIE family protein phosphatase [Bacteroidia bacterium]|nr:SpoIIE family protein phosphatase [Bacteroidia bacterium]
MIVRPAILCIEDELIILKALGEEVSHSFSEYQVELAENSEEALDIIQELYERKQELSLVIADNNLGTERVEVLIKKILLKFPDTLIMMLTGQADIDSIINLVALGQLHTVLTKPWDKEHLYRTVEDAVTKYRQRKQLREKHKMYMEIHRASMSLTGEIRLDKLMNKLMRIVMDNADAEVGYLVLERTETGPLFIEAIHYASSHESIIESIEITEDAPISATIVNFARQSRENIILDDAMNYGFFANHPYIQRNQCRSILCTPLVYQGRFMGMLYLENKSRTSAFSPYSLDLLSTLSAHAAVALQNARIYAEIEQLVQERTNEIVFQKEEIERQRDVIMQKNRDIMESITYAKRIQDAFLPKTRDILAAFPTSFVYFRPKDVVSGDFYWFTQRLSKAVLVAADCTGHGIPGAFMSVMANTLLQQIVELDGVFRPNEILDQLHLRVRVALKQEDDANARDGMDISVLQIDTKRHRIMFSGANRPLVMIRNGEVVEYKGDKFSVGGEQLEEVRNFTLHQIDIEPGDTFYIFTDGFPDQFGEEINKKFQSRRFYQLLQEIYEKDTEHQRLLVDAELRHWRGENEQTDDVLVIGIKF